MGLSGGVDSAVSAALLKKEGFDVTGVFIKAWTPPGYVCGWKEDRRSAMRVCAILDIPFITLDLEKEYKKEVVDYMIAEYKAGRTPNPDVMCNKEIKFGHFLKFALDNGADFVATGHYARILRTTLTKKASLKKSSDLLLSVGQTFFENFFCQLLEGADLNKDQSYFLWTLTQDQLKHILFPIGHLQKEEVRKLAKKFGLPQAIRKDSQGVCFLGKIDMKDFLKEYIGAKKGEVLNEKGEKIGEHDGAILYTMGERHGFKVNNKNTNSEPLFVISKNIKNNTITVAPHAHFKRSLKMYMKEIVLKDVNFIDHIPNKKISCRLRYRQQKIPCKITPHSSNLQESSLYKVVFERSQLDISPGQSLVFYDNEICLGGGIIS